MNKNKNILYDLNSERNDTKIVTKEDNIISDYSVKLCENIDFFIDNHFASIPYDLRCYTIIYDFNRQVFYINNHLMVNKFIKIKLLSLLDTIP